jgi:spoIIIJ-associated protein
MEEFQNQIKKLIHLIGLNEPSVDFDTENRKITIFANEGEYFEKKLPKIINDVEHLVRLIAKKHNTDTFFVDINGYRKERERIITDLAKAAAKKVLIHNQEFKLPAMNAYERRLVHVELAIHPQVETESNGEGLDRCVIVKPLP